MVKNYDKIIKSVQCNDKKEVVYMPGCECGYYPTVIIPGIGQSKTIEVDGNGNKIRNSWPLELDTDGIKKDILAPALRMMLLRHDLGFSDSAARAIARGLDVLACNPDGSAKHRIKVVSYAYPLSECSADEKRYIYKMVPLQRLSDVIGESHLFFFAYNIFGRIGDTVDELDRFIKMVKQKTGHDKVNLAPVSMGATVTTFYLDRYADKGDINRVVGVVPAYDGSVVVSDLMRGNLNVEDYESLFIDLLGKGDGGKINRLIGYMPKKVVEPCVRKIIGSAIKTIVVNSETMWGLVPSGDYPSLRDTLIADEAHAKLREATDKAYQIRRDVSRLVNECLAKGIGFFTMCGYDVRLFKAVASSEVSSDMVVNTSSSSMGAHLAPLGQCLPDDYLQKVSCGHNHISPDRKLDASCGALPETTWYYRGMEHEQSAENDRLLELAKLLLMDNSVTSVHDLPEHPQFNAYGNY